MKKEKSFESWIKKIGALNAETVQKLIPSLSEHDIDDFDGYSEIQAHSASSRALLDFVQANPEYHIATYSIDDLENGGSAYIYSNDYHYVNRMAYYLCKGNKNPNIFFEETNED